MRRLLPLLPLALALACEPATLTRRPGPSGAEDAGTPVFPPAMGDAATPPPIPGVDGGPGVTPDGGTPVDPVDPPTPDAGPPPPPPPPPPPTDVPAGYGPVAGLELTGFEIYQTIRIPLVENGSEVARTIPLIANKPGLLRVYVRPTGSFSSRAVTAFVRIDTGDGIQTLMETATISGASSVETPTSTLNLDVPRELLTPSASISVQLIEMGGTGGSETRYPREEGEMPLGALQNGGIDVVVVPIRYDADGSGRMPDTSTTAMNALRDHLLSMWPVSDVRIRVREAVATSSPVAPTSGQAWGSLLDSVGNIRQNDRAPGNEYYLGLFSPADSFRNFCGGGCIAGIAPLNQGNYQSQRFGLALGYGDENNRYSAIHELGHAHGRPHAPCGGVSGAEPGFPHSGGATGVWGYDFRNARLYNPSTKDFMGYCDPQWVSDYAYQRLHQRVVAVAGGSTLSWHTAPHHVFRLAPFQAPRWSGLVDERIADASDGELTMMKARDRFGRDLGWVGARRVDMSLEGFSSLLVPDVEDAAYFETTGGHLYRVASSGESILHPLDSNVR
ncbi:MAG: M66 family metalloprotease [Polyangiales bacterium]